MTLAACAALQLLPPLVLYCQVAPASMPVTLTVPILVMPSLALVPVSAARAKVGAAGGVVSTGGTGGTGVPGSTLMAVELLDGVSVVLLAASVCLT